MADWSVVSRENLSNLNSLKFNKYDESSFRLSVLEKQSIKKRRDDDTLLLLRKISGFIFSAADKGYASNAILYVSIRCNLSESTIRKVINGSRNATKDFVGRICVGLGLSMSDTEDLFEQLGQPLDFNSCYFDAVTMTAIKDRDSIDDYCEDLKFFEE